MYLTGIVDIKEPSDCEAIGSAAGQWVASRTVLTSILTFSIHFSQIVSKTHGVEAFILFVSGTSPHPLAIPDRSNPTKPVFSFDVMSLCVSRVIGGLH